MLKKLIWDCDKGEVTIIAANGSEHIYSMDSLSSASLNTIQEYIMAFMDVVNKVARDIANIRQEPQSDIEA